MLGSLDECDVSAERGARFGVLAKRALQRKNADLHGLAASRSLPASLGELGLERADLFAAHRFAEPARHLRDDRGVGVMRGGLDDRTRALGRVVRLEDAAADERCLRAE